MKKFNAFQFLALFVSLPFLIQYVWYQTFTGSGLVGTAIGVCYLLLSTVVWEAIYKHTFGG